MPSSWSEVPTDEDLVLRPATVADLPAVAELHIRVRDGAHPAMPPGIHPPHEARAWVAGWDLATYDVWLAESGGSAVGYARFDREWLDDLYVDTPAQGAGVGGALLELVKAQRPAGFCLWVFESNELARDFYRHRGLVELERTDGSANEEKAPDIRMAWPGSEPLAFFRGLIDDIDADLGDLLNRRAALTRAVQPHKTSTERDPEREREIARALAARAPLLGEDRSARIVHAIITESLDAAGES
jgi:chorismate mutase/ribosomal protein S18 acetylase RimI-like enzyme